MMLRMGGATGWQSPTTTAVAMATTHPQTIVATRNQPLSAGAYSPEIAHSLSALIRKSGGAVSHIHPHDSLLNGQWVKLICGASFEDVADVRNLSLVYTLAGVDCIDCAADSSVVSAVREGIDSAIDLADAFDVGLRLKSPWVMVSINDDEDLHFRKAEFDPKGCPLDCPRPCERICPASAIQFNNVSVEVKGNGSHNQNKPVLEGVLTERCYGCGRCLSVCPLGLIGAKTYVRNFEAVSDLLNTGAVDAIEIHTNARHLESFKQLWEHLHSSLQSLKLIAVSLPDLGDDMLSTMWNLYGIMKPYLKSSNLWQMDGRPMSGDIGTGTTRASVALAEKVAAYPNRPPGFLQLAGGTNACTMEALERCGLYRVDHERNYASEGGIQLNNSKIAEHSVKQAVIAGIAYGGYARKIISQVLKRMSLRKRMELEYDSFLLLEALEKAISLIGLSKDFL